MAGFWSWLDYLQTLVAGAFTGGSGPDHWQTLIAGVVGGGLTLIAGILAYRGARRAAKDQVAAVEAQIVDLQRERNKTEERRLSVIRWAVETEAERIDTELLRVDPMWKIGGLTPFYKEPRLIDSSPLLRGEREDIALLDGDTLTTLRKAANTLKQYNIRVLTVVRTDDPAYLRGSF